MRGFFYHLAHIEKSLMPVNRQATVRINDKNYVIADLSAEAKAQLTNLRFTDAEIERLNARLAITQTARNAYLRALAELLPEPSTASLN